MSRYKISIRPDQVIHEFEVTLRGPGLDSGGRRYIFRNPDRAEAFAETVNFVYQQGLRDGARMAFKQSRQLMVVTGRTPDSLRLQPEDWRIRLTRDWYSLRARLRAMIAGCLP